MCLQTEQAFTRCRCAIIMRTRSLRAENQSINCKIQRHAWIYANFYEIYFWNTRCIKIKSQRRRRKKRTRNPVQQVINFPAQLALQLQLVCKKNLSILINLHFIAGRTGTA